ncbi:MAG: hypothetical protein HY744_17065, partial [Deltaproteobacteria bacterium]|nr:hypothetical protein [Deltaproteobacteria bacterium]
MVLQRHYVLTLPLLAGLAWLCTCQGEDSADFTPGPTGGGAAGQGGAVTSGGGAGGAAGEGATGAGVPTGGGGSAGAPTGGGGGSAGGGGAGANGGGEAAGGSAGAAGGGGEGGGPPNICQGHGGATFCDSNVALTCNPVEQLIGVQVCGDMVCVPDVGCQICTVGQYNCWGNEVQICDPGPPAKWVKKNPALVCNPSAGMACDKKSGTCAALKPLGKAPPNTTGTYYQYAYFTKGNSAFKGGCDVGSQGDLLFVNRGNWYEDGKYLDVYQITLLDSDKDGKLEPNQHPNNPKDPGPIEQRVLTFVKTYDVVALGMVHRSENFPIGDRAYFVNPPVNNGHIMQYEFLTGITTDTTPNPTPALDIAFIGWGGVDGKWYGGSEWARRVYSYHFPSHSWVAEFAYPDMVGSHMDGMEVVADPHTGYQYVYVSDMTSDYLGQYRYDKNTGWIQENLFIYTGTPGTVVEGMGFGVLNHFW